MRRVQEHYLKANESPLLDVIRLAGKPAHTRAGEILKASFFLGQYMSHPIWHNGRMKINRLNWRMWDEGKTIATFGDARLVKQLDGKTELIGGFPDDRRAACEWCSRFFHEATFACTA